MTVHVIAFLRAYDHWRKLNPIFTLAARGPDRDRSFSGNRVHPKETHDESTPDADPS